MRVTRHSTDHLHTANAYQTCVSLNYRTEGLPGSVPRAIKIKKVEGGGRNLHPRRRRMRVFAVWK